MKSSEEKTPLVSICCITYNHEKYIRDALEGFLMQKTTFPFEVLIHDDASKDNTANIIREYEAKYPDIIKPIYQTENQYSKGVKVSEIYNFPRARGKYIALCEGDDFWTAQDKLQIQYDFMESHPDYSMCFHKAKVIDGDGKNRGYFDKNEEREYSGFELLKNFVVPTASSFFKREWVTKIPLDKNFWCGDIIVWLTMSQYGKIYSFAKEMSVYRILSTGAVTTFYKRRDKKWLDTITRHHEALKKYFTFIPSDWLFSQEIESSYSCIVYLKNRCSFKEALKVFFRLPLKIQANVLVCYIKSFF